MLPLGFYDWWKIECMPPFLHTYCKTYKWENNEVNCVSVPSLQWSEERMKRVMNEAWKKEMKHKERIMNGTDTNWMNNLI